jgi:hypothetical protein
VRVDALVELDEELEHQLLGERVAESLRHGAFGLSLCRIAGWTQLEADWRRLLALSPEGVFVAEEGGRLNHARVEALLPDLEIGAAGERHLDADQHLVFAEAVAFDLGGEQIADQPVLGLGSLRLYGIAEIGRHFFQTA